MSATLKEQLLLTEASAIGRKWPLDCIGNLIEAANKVAAQGSRKSPALVVLKKKAVKT